MLYQLLAATLAIVSTTAFFDPQAHLANIAQMKSPFGLNAFSKRQLVQAEADVPPKRVGDSIVASWSDCTSSNAKGSVSNVIFTPNPPTYGGNTTITGMGTVSEAVTEGTWELKVYDGALKVLDSTGDICKSDTEKLPLSAGYLYYFAQACPIAAGSVNVTLVADISTSAPNSTIKTTLTAKDTDKNELFCVEVDFDISK